MYFAVTSKIPQEHLLEIQEARESYRQNDNFGFRSNRFSKFTSNSKDKREEYFDKCKKFIFWLNLKY